MPNAQDPGLGLPTAGRSAALPTERDRPFMEYTLPEAHLGLGWGSSEFGDADRTFRLVEITPRQQDQAAKVAGNNPSALGRELMFHALWQVGDWKTRRERDRLNRWWDAIGSKGRRLVEAAFMRMQSVEEADVDSFLDSGKPNGSTDDE